MVPLTGSDYQCGNLVTAEVMLENIERFRNLPCFINVIYDELMNSSRSEEIY